MRYLLPVALFLALIALPVSGMAEDENMICSCWLTAYDYGIRGMGSEYTEYQSGYRWCENNGYWSGRAWIDGWDSGYYTASGGIRIPRDCQYFFDNNY